MSVRKGLPGRGPAGASRGRQYAQSAKVGSSRRSHRRLQHWPGANGSATSMVIAMTATRAVAQAVSVVLAESLRGPSESNKASRHRMAC